MAHRPYDTTLTLKKSKYYKNMRDTGNNQTKIHSPRYRANSPAIVQTTPAGNGNSKDTPPTARRKEKKEYRLSKLSYIPPLELPASAEEAKNVLLSNRTFHRHQQHTELCYIFSVVTAIGYMVYLKYLDYDTIDPFVQFFISHMTNLRWEEKTKDEVKKNFIWFDAEYLGVLRKYEKIKDKDLFKIVAKDLTRDETWFDGGLAFCTLEVFQNKCEYLRKKIKSKLDVTPSKRNTRTHSSERNLSSISKDEGEWKACIIGLVRCDGSGHYICVVRGEKGALTWFDTLNLSCKTDADIKREYPSDTYEVDDLLYLNVLNSK